MRFHGFDFLRVIGILAVVYIHGSDTNEVARRGMKWLGFAVPCFFMMSAFLAQLSILKKPETGFGQLIGARVKRLAPPFILWSVVYLAVRFAKSAATGASIHPSATGVLFWGDASHQLYFVPLLIYLFLVWTVVMMLARKQMYLAMTLCIVAAVVSVAFAPHVAQALPENRWFVAHNLVWFPAAMLIALVAQSRPQWARRLFWPALVSALAMGWFDVVNVYWVSFTVFALALSIQRPAPKWMLFLSKYSFGVYLVHVLLIEGMQFVAPRIGLEIANLPTTLTVIVAAAIGSYAVCGVLGRHDASRWSVT